MLNNNDATSPLLGDMSSATFMSQYWQKKPCIFRGVLKTELDNLPGIDELAGFAVEDEVESRLIFGSPGLSKVAELSLQHGPFDSEMLAQLPETNWTLLLQSMDLWAPEFAAIIQWVNFLPRWRLDDVMVSIAAPGGGVGPHRDQYDVFLIQQAGERRWKIAPPSTTADFEPITDLLLVENFTAKIDEVLSKGDVLYLPPGWLHWGIAESLCVTCSIGFRAPDTDAILQNLLDEISMNPELNQRFTDAWRKPSAQMSISDNDLLELSRLIHSIAQNKDLLLNALAKQVTLIREDSEIFDKSAMLRKMENYLSTENFSVQLTAASRMTFKVLDAGKCCAFVNGESYIFNDINDQEKQLLLQFLDRFARHQAVIIDDSYRTDTFATFIQFLIENDSLFII